MLTSVMLATFALVPQGAKEIDDPKSIAKQIHQALKQGAAPAAASIVKYGHHESKYITTELGRACRHKDTKVRVAAIQALRFNKGPDAFAQLYRQRSNRLVVKESAIAKEYYLAIGQHGDKRALPLLSRDLSPSSRRDEVLSAKVMAIGRIREKASVETLIRFVAKSRKGAARDLALTALYALTGHREKSAIGWSRWWKENRRSIRFDEKEPQMSKREARSWTDVWREPGTATTDARSRAERREARNKKKDGKSEGGSKLGKSGGGDAGKGEGQKGGQKSGGAGKAADGKKRELTGERRKRLRK